MERNELEERAVSRSFKVKTYRLTGGAAAMFLVHSQTREGYHRVATRNGAVVACDCEGWYFRQSCMHAAAVTKRLKRKR